MIAVALMCIACAAFWLWQRHNITSEEPPMLPGCWPIVGHVLKLIGDSCKLKDTLCTFFKQSYDLGGVGTVRFGLKTLYVVTDPDDMFTVANTCLEKDGYYEFAKPWFGEGLITAKSSTWKIHRKILNPAFSQHVLDRFMPVFNSQSRKLIDALDREIGQGFFDHWMYIRSNALETICLTGLGVDYTDDLLNKTYFIDTVDILFTCLVERLTKFWLHSPYTFRFSNLKKKQDAYFKIVHKLSDTVLQKRKSKLNGITCAETSIAQGTRFKAFMDLLLELSLDKGVLNEREIREHIDTIIVAGYDTSANVLMYTMLLLGAHPQVQEKLFTELKEVLGDGDKDVEKQDLSKLVYLEAVIKESMRIYPITPVVARKLDRDVKLKNCTLLAGSSCILFIFGLHRHPIWGPNRNEFIPERWLDPSRLPDNPNAFAAFSFGKRMCIGKMYALMSMKTTLAHVMRRYRITADISQLRLKMDILLKPVQGYFISIERRTKPTY